MKFIDWYVISYEIVFIFIFYNGNFIFLQIYFFEHQAIGIEFPITFRHLTPCNPFTALPTLFLQVEKVPCTPAARTADLVPVHGCVCVRLPHQRLQAPLERRTRRIPAGLGRSRLRS